MPTATAKDESIINDSTNLKLRTIKKQAASEVESYVLKKTLAEFNGNVSKVAKHLGVSTRAIYKKLSILKISPAAFRHKI